MPKILIPDPIQIETTAEATDLSTAIALSNALKSKCNTIINQYNLLVESIESLNDDN